MERSPRYAGVSGPPLIRLLARLARVDAAESRLSSSDRLSQWLGWTDAIALSTALNGNPRTLPGDRGPGARDDDAEYHRLRTALAEAIANDRMLASGRGGAAGKARARPDMPAMDTDYALYRQCHLSLQQTMQTGIAQLRVRLRDRLACGTPAMAKLAEVDAVMEQALGAREHQLLARTPAMLERHFHDLRSAGEARMAACGQSAEIPETEPASWLQEFRKDMRRALLAELDIRLQPLEGLLCALRDR